MLGFRAMCSTNRAIALANTYKARVEADGGVVVSLDDVKLALNAALNGDYYSNIKFWGSAQFGVKKSVTDYVNKLYDLSPNNNDAVNVGTSNVPWQANQKNGKAALCFTNDGQFLSIPGNPISRTMTQYSIVTLARITDKTANRTLVDITEMTDTVSILYRNIFLTASGNTVTQIRDNASVTNQTSITEPFDLDTIITGVRNGNGIAAYRNKVYDGAVSTNAIGSMDTGSFYTTIGAVRNSGSVNGTSFMRGNIYEVMMLNTNITTTVQDSISTAIHNRWYPVYSPLVYTDRQQVLDLGGVGAWDSARILAPDVVKDGSTYYMFYSGSSTISLGFQIGVASSSDGINWTRYGTTPVLPLGTAGQFDDTSVLDGHVIKIGSTWTIYYQGRNSTGVEKIGRATASSPTGPWTKQGVVLEATETWEGYPSDPKVASCSVAQSGGIIYLYYYAITDEADHLTELARSGVASSSDGVTFTKSANNPLLPVGASNQWDSKAAEVLSLIRDPSTQEIYQHSDGYYYQMFDGLKSWSDSPLKWRIGSAKSSAITTGWIKCPIPTIDKTTGNESYGTGGPNAIKVGDEVWLYYELLDGTTNRIGRIVFPLAGFTF